MLYAYDYCYFVFVNFVFCEKKNLEEKIGKLNKYCSTRTYFSAKAPHPQHRNEKAYQKSPGELSAAALDRSVIAPNRPVLWREAVEPMNRDDD